jgi:hypothetical protein
MYINPQRKASTTCGNANGQDVGSSFEVKLPASAAPSVNETTAPSTSAKNAHEPLPQPDGCSEQLTSAVAPTATEAALLNEEDRPQVLKCIASHLLDLMRQCNSLQLCARCGHVVNGGSLRATVWGEIFILCKRCTPVMLRMSEYQHVLEAPK